eukprot:CAMPEP_0184698934 /NCGR_PEP_ID=MMETSP0313-20130426/5377_1 /TAXON_ID=2792 /ORGANISM="Porphyridium aerugineum, Strain SAG 1380-2" /LENGTH=60 /DNA_ID=CAMNT_0027157939 /DNA_START=1 /DNA_END=179 /DNA_ORIENTATION=+
MKQQSKYENYGLYFRHNYTETVESERDISNILSIMQLENSGQFEDLYREATNVQFGMEDL